MTSVSPSRPRTVPSAGAAGQAPGCARSGGPATGRRSTPTGTTLIQLDQPAGTPADTDPPWAADGPDVYSLVYVSAATPPVNRASLRALMVQSRRANAADQITGLLLYREGTYMQMLEGDHDRVEALYAAIRRDPRHQEIITVRTRQQDHRQFPRWTMGFGDLTALAAPTGRDEDVVFGLDIDIVLDSPVPAAQTVAEAELVAELLDLFDTI